MGNACKSAFNFFTSSCLRRSKDNPTPTSAPPNSFPEEMKKFVLGTKKIDVSQLTPLVEFIDNRLSQIKGILEDMGRVTVDAVKVIGQSHWVLLGLSMVASVLKRIETVSSNVSECVELLEMMAELAKNLQKLNTVLSQESHKQLNRAVEIIVEGATICCDYIAEGKTPRFWSTRTVESQLEKTRNSIQEITASLNLTTGVDIAEKVGNIEKGTSHHEEESPHKLLEIGPVGIDDRVEAVKNLLEVEGSKAALAVILYGFGGVGKSTLASSVIQNLNLKNFKFSRVIVDGENPDKISHIVKLQKDIISDLEEKNLGLRNDYEGRQKLGEVLKSKSKSKLGEIVKSKSCFLFIDNVVDKEYIRKLLPRDLSVGENKLRILVTSRDINVKQEINIDCKEHLVEPLLEQISTELLRKTILQGQEVTARVHIINDEDKMISDIAKACYGVPLLLDTYGKYLKYHRSEAAYRDARNSLIHGNIGGIANDKDLSEQLLYVYDRMGEDKQEAFLDICTYFNGWKWHIVSSVVGEVLLNDLVSIALVKKDVKSDEVTVHDILRLMGTKKVKGTRMQSTAELSQILQGEQDVSSAKGIRLQSPFKLQSRYLNAMYKSLRVLILENGITIDGDQCNNTFHNLLFLQVRNVNTFPFKDASQLPNLRVFYNESEHGMALGKLPETLKELNLTISPTYEMSAALPICWANMSSLPELQKFEMRTSTMVEFPENFRLPKSLVELNIRQCKQLPKGFDSLTALRKLKLKGCTQLTALPEELGSFRSLMSLRFGSLGKLEWFSLSGCMESLPEDCGNLCNLKTLILKACGNLSSIKGLEKLHSLESLEISECLKELPERFHELPLRYLDLSGCSSLGSLPMRFGELRSLEDLYLRHCLNLSALPDGFGNLTTLRWLSFLSCRKLTTLPNGFGNLKSLRYLELDSTKLDRLPPDFKHLSCLNELCMTNCTMLEEETMDRIVTLESLYLLNISWSNKLEKRWEEMQKEEKEYPLVVRTSKEGDALDGQFQVEMYRRAAAVAFFHGQCLMVDRYEKYETVSSSNRIAETRVALLIGYHNQIQRMGGVLKSALERLRLPASTMIVYIAVDTDDSDQSNGSQILKLLPGGSIASIDFRTRALFREAFYHDEGAVLVSADVVKDEKGFKRFVNFNNISVDFLKETGQTIFYGFGEFVRGVKHSEDTWILQLDNGHPCIDQTNQFKKFRDILEKNGIYHFVDNQRKKVNLADLEGTVVSLFICNADSVICCEQMCKDLQLKRYDFKGIWIPFYRNFNSPGLGDFNRILHERMPMVTLLDPVLLDTVSLSDEISCVIVFDREGRISCPNALHLMTIWGVEFYPFTMERLKEILNRESIDVESKSSFDFLIGERDFLNSRGFEVKKESLGGKVVMLYGGSPESDFNSKLISLCKKLKDRLISNFETVYVGCPDEFVADEKFYCDKIPCPRLPSTGMVSFWNRCFAYYIHEKKFMSRNSPKKRMFWRLVNHIVMMMAAEDSKRGWAVVFDGDGEMVALRGKEVVEMLWKSDGKEEEKMIAEAIIESIQNGDCCEIKRRFGDQQEEEVGSERGDEIIHPLSTKSGAERRAVATTSHEIIPTSTSDEVIHGEHPWRVFLFIIGGVVLYNIFKNKLQTL
eukprot:Gb_15441 [translate_table: standard]